MNSLNFSLTEKYNFLIVNDQHVARHGLQTIVEQMPISGTCDLAENGMIALNKMKRQSYDVVLLDLSMPVMDGPTTFQNIKKYHPSCKVIIVSMYNEKSQVVDLYNSGIDGYLLIGCDSLEYQTAICKVLSNEKHFTLEVKMVIDKFEESITNRTKKILNSELSRREVEILDCISKEMSAKKIAEKLNISEFTVNNHRSNIIKKLGVDSSVGLIMEAMKRGILKV
jgi:DNA-binding NarL/FixJ family response regulator